MKFDIAQKLLTAGFYALTMVTVAGTAMAASDYPDAAASDPNTLGLMQGFPPAPDKRVMQPDSNFFSFPKLRWTVCHIRELMPTKQVSRGLGGLRRHRDLGLPVGVDGNPDRTSAIRNHGRTGR